MILTSYFSNYRNFPLFINKVSISRFSPKWFTADQYAIELAPSKNLLNLYKTNRVNDKEYTKIYIEETLSQLDPIAINQKYKDSVFLCFESNSDFCHRHLVSKWLNNAGIESFELENSSHRIGLIFSYGFSDSLKFEKIMTKILTRYSKVSFVIDKSDRMITEFAAKLSIDVSLINLNDSFLNHIDIVLSFWNGSDDLSYFIDLCQRDKKQFFMYNYINNTWFKY